ncbi:HAD-IA family hydrolase [Halomonas sp. MCCC 1A17488]|uniref:HAD-IA family hydrolase n=1 Tax=Billgrantia sulfidoxydans TaxID=2733484 RepID=A0ABX7W2Y0_9GAMM|nr:MULTISPECIES: HAD-IA family hydrolase [Halomonas]MCE8015670.1 HAD-IA family hydrolase [Halomonas sp. MCCC 1A17488]MCG3239003.1 HAD-IA family hydrolase [Halomonas sp. MCCC 1A17488]QPP51046.1 HAD-IA family hydrolase [Halomonas sp. SS10-MC5]QTP54558.1 HAD-IA family hydrolase [Halomonas sulfidoxydans]
MRYRLVIFDWDGTLMDSAARIVACMQAAARDAGWGHLEEAAVRDIIGLGLPEAIDRLCPGIDAERFELLRSRYAHHFVEGNRTPMPFFAGVEAGIATLREPRARRLAVATGKSRRGLERVFRESGSGGWFHASRTADETRSKPHPQMLEELLVELDVPVEEAVMVGDTEYDMEMARALGMDRVAVTWGVHAPERLAASRPVYTAQAVTELFDWLNR